ncbi:hypothetical protein RVBP21_3500 [Pseudomonas phage BRkr]|nr:hypothetical protein RVBP21_3500 [Pseudomonas phage BRkr]
MAKNRNRGFSIPTVAKLVEPVTPVIPETPQETPVEYGPLSIEELQAAFEGHDDNEVAALVAPVLAALHRDAFYDDDGRMLTCGEVVDKFDTDVESEAEAEDSGDPKGEEESDLEETTDLPPEGETEEELADPEPTPALVDLLREEATAAISEPEVVEEVKPLVDTPVSGWTKEELELYIKGELVEDVRYNVLKEAIVEHQRREATLDLAWNPQQCKEFLVSGIVPDKTSKGAWKSDITRFARKATQWTTQELESWALGEIRPEGSTSEPALAVELKERLMLVSKSNAPEDVILAYKAQTGQTTQTTHLTGTIPTAAAPKVDVEAVRIQLSYEGLTEVNQTYIEETLKKYKEICAPGKPLTPQTGVMAQKQLDNVIRYVINLEDPVGFKNGMEIIRKFITENRKSPGLFDDSHAFRFTDGLSVQGGVQESHIQILTLFFIFADENKEARTQYDVPSLVSLFPTKRQPLLLQYFQQVQ